MGQCGVSLGLRAGGGGAVWGEPHGSGLVEVGQCGVSLGLRAGGAGGSVG